MKRGPSKCRAEKKYWRDAWIVGLVVLVVYAIFHIKFYHLYFYFFLLSIIALYSEWRGWAEIGENGILFRFGILRSSILFISWKEIDNIDKVFIKERIYVRAGAFGAVRTDDFIDLPCIAISMNNQLSATHESFIRKQKRRTIVLPSIKACDDRKGILVVDPPGGIEDMLAKSKLYLLKEIIMNSANAGKQPALKRFFSFFDFLLIISTMIIYVLFSISQIRP